MSRIERLVRTLALPLRTLALALFAVVAAGCTNGQLVDAGGERGGGGLAFVLLAAFFGLFFAAIFYMDRVRKRNASEDDTPPS